MAKITAGGGLEFLLGGSIPLRGGYRFDQVRRQHAVTGGAGYVDKAFGVSFGMRQTLSGVSETRMNFAIQYFVR